MALLNGIEAGMFPKGLYLYRKHVQLYCTLFSDQVRGIFHRIRPGLERKEKLIEI